MRGMGLVEPAPRFGIITALPIECVAVRTMVDGVIEAPTAISGDGGTYYLGTVPSTEPERPHRVAVTVLTEDGGPAAAHACANLQRSWRVRQIVMCGIACGVPAPDNPPEHVRLGDILVATDGVIPYGHVRALTGAEEIRRHPARPSVLLKNAANRLSIGEETGERPWDLLLAERDLPGLRGYRRPPASSDVILDDETGIPVPHPSPARSGHLRDRPKVHYGRMGSGGKLFRNSAERNRLARRYQIMGFDMEGDGVSGGSYLQGADWFMVRGVSDYGASDKNDAWRRYAALAAAAYLRALLATVAPVGSGCAGLAVAPPPAPAPRVGATEQEALVGALMEIRSMRDRTGRDQVVAALPAPYRTRLTRCRTASADVAALVRDLCEIPSGLLALYQVLFDIERASAPVRRFGALVVEAPDRLAS
jgi:nucleoside phosphorylase